MRPGERVLVVGATSSIARATAERLGQAGARLHLAGRDAGELERIAADLAIRCGTVVTWSTLEATGYASHGRFLEQAAGALGGLDGVVMAMGTLGDQARAEAEFAEAERIITANFTGVASVLTSAANYLERQGSGFLVVISSVAGDRGRAQNYVYGAAKAGINTFVQGMRARLARSGVQVLTVKPGFVDTKMTFGMRGMFLVASPERVASDIFAALEGGKDVVYTPWFWSVLMGVVRAIPERLFKKLKV